MPLLPLPSDSFFHTTSATNYCGVDEAGRGCLAGPVVAAAAIFPVHYDFTQTLFGLDDSKKLSEKKRLLLAPLITTEAIAYGVGISWPAEIDAINIVNATFRAMSRALLLMQRNFPRINVPHTYIDGNLCIRKSEWDACASCFPKEWHAPYFPARKASVAPLLQQDYSFPFTKQEAIIGGDRLIPCISAASILAKTTRDAIMTNLDSLYPGYTFSRHKGYGTKAHVESIRNNGPCPLHRKTFLQKIFPEATPINLFT